ncbi:hypothetical protein BH683_023500 [Williamsia sp. 1138]|uniref:DUF3618 domain-containing protein n=1 Tax=Williamsia sp. 1138 TaxID=1903117 RepID=UPI000A0FE679|nr:DUF3618 domain-containing protein [Williamsia sp. 1138]OZG26840.1 hypothetical protein BH683_023500 [Williamsia sp. 1138]
MGRDTDGIERDIERARDELAGTLDALATRASPARLAEDAKSTALTTLRKPAVAGSLIAVGVVVLAVVFKKIAS